MPRSSSTLNVTRTTKALTRHVVRLRRNDVKRVSVNVVELEALLKSINWIVAENQALLRELSQYRREA